VRKSARPADAGAVISPAYLEAMAESPKAAADAKNALAAALGKSDGGKSDGGKSDGGKSDGGTSDGAPAARGVGDADAEHPAEQAALPAAAAAAAAEPLAWRRAVLAQLEAWGVLEGEGLRAEKMVLPTNRERLNTLLVRASPSPATARHVTAGGFRRGRPRPPPPAEAPHCAPLT
jgi:hypothetical protein